MDTQVLEAPVQTTEAPASKPKRKPVAKKASKKNGTAKAHKASVSHGPTVREKVFKLIKDRPMTGPAIMTKLGLSGVPSFLKDELFGPKPRIRRTVEEDVRGVLYGLTAAGRHDLEKGLVNDNAAPASGGKPVPKDR